MPSRRFTRRASAWGQLDKPMTCLSSDGIRSCELKLGLKKTALLMTAQNGHANTSLIGCYYLFQK